MHNTTVSSSENTNQQPLKRSSLNLIKQETSHLESMLTRLKFNPQRHHRLWWMQSYKHFYRNKISVQKQTSHCWKNQSKRSIIRISGRGDEQWRSERRLTNWLLFSKYLTTDNVHECQINFEMHICDPSAQNQSQVAKFDFKILSKNIWEAFFPIDTLLQILTYLFYMKNIKI